MKKIFASIASIASIAALVGFVSCQKTEIKPSPIAEGSTFTLSADIQQTKTTINGRDVNWEEGDVLYLVTTDGTWGKPYTEDKSASSIAEYTYSAGSFTSEANIADGTYTFNALYDGSASQKSYHRGASTTYMLQSTQSQDCSNPTGHLKLNDALVGTFTASVPMANPASVSMSHIFAIMRVDIKNATGADVELKSFEMSAAGATLAGIFTVNFAKTPNITEKSGQSSSIKVNLTNGTVAAGESLPVYFVMAPLADYSGDVTFTVTDVNDVEYTKTVALTKKISFKAGSLNTTPYTIKTGVAPEKAIYSTEFNYSTVTDNGQTYYDKGDEYIGTDTDATTSWGITYGNWNGSNCAQLRVYTAGNFGSVYTKFDVSYATKVSYKAKVSDTNLTLNTYYSTDSGKNWVKVDNAKALSTKLTEYSFTISKTGEFAKNRIKFEVSGTKPSSKNYQLTIDDVSIYGNGEVLETVITKLDAPKNLMADISTSSVNSIEVVWDAVDNAGSYMVTAKPASGTEVSKEVTTNSCTFTGLEYNTDYTISIYAKSSDTGLFTDSDAVTYAETVTTGPKPSTGGANTTTLSNANITAVANPDNSSSQTSGYRELTYTDGNGFEYSAYAISTFHSKATNQNCYIQIKKYASNTAYYVKLPQFTGNIKSIHLVVSGSSKAMDGGGNTATIFFSSSNSTSAAGANIVSGTGASEINIDAASLNLNTGYLTASGAVRIWEITVEYSE